jgi:iron complex outermembrane recepter protein
MNKRNSEQHTIRQSSRRISLTKTMLALCIGAAVHPAVWAQSAEPTSTDAKAKPASAESDQQQEELDTIVVVGIRRSLKTAQDMKRDADTHVDAISASDINSLPDVSVLEALQRVPGVSIERFAASNDPDHFSTEGSGVTLRGLPNTRSEFNGRDTFSANSGRGLSFQDVPPELLGSVEIFKNQTADMIEGGISGTVNLNTRKPFDSGDRILSFSAQANYGDLEKETTPSFSGIYSDRWETGGGEFGLLASVSKSDLDFRSDGVQFGVHNSAAGGLTPINGGIRTTSTNRKREGASLGFQFRNTDRTFELLAEWVHSDSDTNWLEYAFFSDDAARGGVTNATYSDGIFQSGTLTGVSGGFGPQTRRSDGNTAVDDFSLKLDFNPTEKFSVSTDLQYVKSTTDIIDLSVFGGLVGGLNTQLSRNGDTARVNFLAPTGSAQTDAQYFSDPRNYFWRAAMDHIEESEGDELAARLDFRYTPDSDFVTSVESGLRYSERDQTTRWSTYNWGNLSESWTGNGQALFDGTPSRVPATGQVVFSNNQASPFSFGRFHNGNVGGLPGGVGLFANAALVSDFARFRSNFDVPGINRGSLSGRQGAIGFYLPAEINGTNEQNTAAYIRMNFEGGDEHRWSGNAGFRYVRQDTRVNGGITFPTLNLSPAVLATLPADVRAFANGASNTDAAQSSYNALLPSLNIKYELAPDLIMRFGVSKALAFPELGNLRYNYNINAQITTTNNVATLDRFFRVSGNPFLEPMSSTNFDLSLEYYFGATDYVSAAFFHKDIKNFFSSREDVEAITNNGVTQLVEVSQPTNIGEGTINGFEFAYQQFFDSLPGVLSGLGMQFNYTYLNPSELPQQNLRPVQSGSPSDADRASVPFDGLPLQGLSKHQFNLVGLFQNAKFEARLAYNWRDDYLLTIREVNIGLPTFAKARGQLDGSVFYRFNDQWQIGLEASNLLQDEVVTENQVSSGGPKVFRSSFLFDTRYSLVVRAQF